MIDTRIYVWHEDLGFWMKPYQNMLPDTGERDPGVAAYIAKEVELGRHVVLKENGVTTYDSRQVAEPEATKPAKKPRKKKGE